MSHWRFVLTAGIAMVCGCAHTSCSGTAANEEVLLATPVAVTTPPHAPGDPVSIGAAAWPESAATGELMVVVIRIEIAPAWHVYGAVRPGSPNFPVTLTLTSFDALTPIGPWHGPTPKDDPTTGDSILDGTVEYRRLFRVAPEATSLEGSDVSVTVTYQACDPLMCLPPTAKNVVAQVGFARDT